MQNRSSREVVTAEISTSYPTSVPQRPISIIQPPLTASQKAAFDASPSFSALPGTVIDFYSIRYGSEAGGNFVALTRGDPLFARPASMKRKTKEVNGRIDEYPLPLCPSLI
jgi:hypothetical protein